MANYSGLWDGFYQTPYVQLGAQIGFTENTNEFNSTKMRRLAKYMRQKGDRVLARLWFTLTGVVAGSTATETLSRLTAVQGIGDSFSNGGQRTVAAVTLVNRATTAGDQTQLRSILTQAFGPTLVSGYPTDKGGGGGGKLGAF
jgi:hypothetical protein